MDFAVNNDSKEAGASAWAIGIRVLCYRAGVWPVRKRSAIGAVLWKRAISFLRLAPESCRDWHCSCPSGLDSV
jgi:hypothetical protein